MAKLTQKKIAEITAADARLKATVKAAHNEALYTDAKAVQAQVRKFQNRKTPSSEWTDADVNAYSKAIDQYRYLTLAVTKGNEALQLLHSLGLTMKDTGRNRYGKALCITSIAAGKAGKFEQSAPMEKFIQHWLSGDELTDKMTVTCRDIANHCAAGDSFKGNTQPYAIIEALVNVGAGEKVMSGNSASWHNSKIILNPESEVLKMLAKQFA